MHKLKIAIIGVGQISVQSHLPAVLGHPGWELVALCDPRVDAVKRVAGRYGTRAAVVADYREVLDRCDAAIVATPNSSHGPITLECLSRGVHVLVEKPMATTSSEAHAICDASARQDRHVAVGYVTRFRPNVLLLKRLLDQERFGKVRRFYHQFGTQGGWAPESGYILDAKNAGGGVLTVTGTHFLDRMLHLWGRPDSVDYADDASGGPEAHCEVRFGYSDGMIGMARYSKVFPMNGRLLLDTDAGVVSLDDSDAADIVRVCDQGGRTLELIREPKVDRRDTFWLQLDDLRTAILQQRPPRVDARQGLMSAQLIERAYAANRGLGFKG